MPLLLKNFYSLSDACQLLNDQLKRTDIDVDFLMQLAFTESIEIGVLYNTSQKELGSLIFHDKQLQYQNQKEIRICLNTCFHYLSQSRVLLIADKEDIFEIYTKEKLPIETMQFNNIYSILNNTLAIPKEYLPLMGTFSYYSHVPWKKFYKLENVPASSLNAESDNAMTQTIWFDYFDTSLNHPLEKIILPNTDATQSITKNDLYILANEIEKILSNKIQTQTVKTLDLNNFNLGNFIDQHTQNKSTLHPNTHNNVVKILAALTHFAQLDISKPHKAFTVLQKHCDQSNLKIPNKDTVAKWFEEAHEYLENSK
ncbi:hypothetical protein VXO75_08395 [Acinetobacter towneri]|uniref:hypothetical protein n=1 Tax=Acinetobacter towneri TaxID=202956 RepID=UPI003A85B528